MNKQDVKNILISLRTAENAAVVNNLLGKIDLKTEADLQKIVEQVGGTEEAVRARLILIIEENMKKYTRAQSDNHDKFPINKIFTYGVSEDTIHLHLPIDIKKEIKGGPGRKLATVNLYLINAVEKAAQMREKCPSLKSIYMISPILAFETKHFNELEFLKDLDFETVKYSKEQLHDAKFLEENPEAVFAKGLFGDEQPIGRAKIAIEAITTTEWQAKKDKKVQEFNAKGIFIDESISNQETPKNENEEEPEQ